jgi:plasmid stability protein
MSMRTTLDLDPTVVEAIRRRGAREGKSMGAVASELLAIGLARTSPPEPRALEWRSRDLGQPRVDLEDKEALRALLERDG